MQAAASVQSGLPAGHVASPAAVWTEEGTEASLPRGPLTDPLPAHACTASHTQITTTSMMRASRRLAALALVPAALGVHHFKELDSTRDLEFLGMAKGE